MSLPHSITDSPTLPIGWISHQAFHSFLFYQILCLTYSSLSPAPNPNPSFRGIRPDPKIMGTEISEPLIVDKKDIDGGGVELERIPEWKEQITIRGLAVSALLGALFCIITHKLNLTVGIIPSLNVGAGLLGFFFVKSWTGFLTKLGFQVSPFTKQENTVIQTCVVACYGLAFSGKKLKMFLNFTKFDPFLAFFS